MPISYTVVGPVTKKIVKPPTQPPGNSGGGKPAKPTNLTATADGVDIALAWTDNADNETGYRIQRSLTNKNADFSTIATIAADSTSYDDEGLDPETTYYYRVAAVRNNRRSSWSNKANDTTGLGIEVPVLEAYQRSDSAGSTVNPFVMAAPSGITAGELLLLIVMANTSSLSDNPRLTAPAGFTKLGETPLSNQTKTAVFYKIATGSEGNQNIVQTSSNYWYVGWYCRVSGADTSNPINTSLFRWTVPGANSATINEINTAADACLGIYGISKQYGTTGAAGVIGAPNNGWTEEDQYYSGGSGTSYFTTAAFGTKALTNAGASGDTTVTIDGASTRECSHFQLAVNPAGYVDLREGPVIESYQETNSGDSTTTSMSFAAPSGIEAGDLLVILAANDDAGDGVKFNAVSGWTKAGEHGNSATDCHVAMYYKIATGSEGAVSVTTVGAYRMCGLYIRVSGVDNADPLNYEQDAGFGDTATYTYLPNPGKSTDEANCLIIGAFAYDAGGLRAPYYHSGDQWFEIDQSTSGAGSSSAGLIAVYRRGLPLGSVNQVYAWGTTGDQKVFIHAGFNPA